jgi:hypothetical protein
MEPWPIGRERRWATPIRGGLDTIMESEQPKVAVGSSSCRRPGDRRHERGVVFHAEELLATVGTSIVGTRGTSRSSANAKQNSAVSSVFERVAHIVATTISRRERGVCAKREVSRCCSAYGAWRSRPRSVRVSAGEAKVRTPRGSRIERKEPIRSGSWALQRSGPTSSRITSTSARLEQSRL